jgi:hypothetical protein
MVRIPRNRIFVLADRIPECANLWPLSGFRGIA